MRYSNTKEAFLKLIAWSLSAFNVEMILCGILVLHAFPNFIQNLDLTCSSATRYLESVSNIPIMASWPPNKRIIVFAIAHSQTHVLY